MGVGACMSDHGQDSDRCVWESGVCLNQAIGLHVGVFDYLSVSWMKLYLEK